MRRCAAIAAVVLCAASLPARPQGGSAAAGPESEVELKVTPRRGAEPDRIAEDVKRAHQRNSIRRGLYKSSLMERRPATLQLGEELRLLAVELVLGQGALVAEVGELRDLVERSVHVRLTE